MMKRYLSVLFILLVSVGPAAGQEAGEPTAADDPGEIRYDKNGAEQMWGGPALTEIRSEQELERVLADTARQPALIFKHSTQCPISARAAARVQRYAQQHPDGPAIYWLKVIESRPASNLLTSFTGVQHESPQILLIDDGKAEWNTSHDAITAQNIDAGLKYEKDPQRVHDKSGSDEAKGEEGNRD